MNNPFSSLSELEQLAIRYYLRKKGFVKNYESACDKIALDKNLLSQLATEYKKYAGIKDE